MPVLKSSRLIVGPFAVILAAAFLLGACRSEVAPVEEAEENAAQAETVVEEPQSTGPRQRVIKVGHEWSSCAEDSLPLAFTLTNEDGSWSEAGELSTSESSDEVEFDIPLDAGDSFTVNFGEDPGLVGCLMPEVTSVTQVFGTADQWQSLEQEGLDFRITLDEAPLLSASWEDADGYSYQFELIEPQSQIAVDIENAKPGYVIMEYMFGYQASLQNTTPGRIAPVPLITVTPIWSQGNVVCDLLIPTPYFTDSDETGGFCTVNGWHAMTNVTDANPSELPVDASENLNAYPMFLPTNMRAQAAAEVPEDVAEAVERELNDPEGWVLGVEYSTGGNTASNPMPVHVSSCDVWAGKPHQRVLASSLDIGCGV